MSTQTTLAQSNTIQKPIEKPVEKPIVIVPTYNERDNVAPLIEKIFQSVPTIHVLFVDDNSKDGTQDVINGLMEKHPSAIHLLKRAGKLGLGTAYIAGFKWALERGYDAIIEMDADHSHDPKILKTMLQELRSHDAVIGSRYVIGGGTVNWSFIRKCISIFGSFYSRTILGMSVRDLTGGFNAWRRDTIIAIGPDRVRSEGYSFQIELKYRAYRAGKTIIETPIIFEERRAGQSKMSLKIVIEAMFRVWSLKGLVNKSS
jgi:dolichol-phosphate mannosyltransferase